MHPASITAKYAVILASHNSLFVLSADHIIQDINSFHQSIEIAKDLAEKDKLVTFGIFPNKPETGYGYIEVSNNNPSNDYFNIKSFTEKPNEKTAKKYIDLGNYLWNSGMFMMKKSIWLENILSYEEKLFKACQSAMKNGTKDDYQLLERLESQYERKTADRVLKYLAFLLWDD